MALSSKAAFIPTTNEFLAHWALVDAALPPAAPVVLPEEPGVIPPGFNRSGLNELKSFLQANLEVVQDKLNDVEINSGGLALLKAKLYKRLTLFLEVVDGFYANTEFYAARPEAPGLGAGEEKFIDPLRDAKSLWTKLNAAAAPAGLTLPIVLNEGTAAAPLPVALAEFSASLELLKGKYEGRSAADQALKLARGRRDRTMESIRAVLVAYRKSVVPRLAGNQTLLASIPRVTPEPGHTPDAVTATAVFQAPDVAKVSHSASDDADFKEYELRATVGASGDAEDAIVLGSHPARTPADFFTQHGLGAPGGTVSLWVYVITNDGNERGSARMVVTRPG